jgi:tetratricopeptide (TPR) repeat protein
MKGEWVKIQLVRAFPSITRTKSVDLNRNGQIDANERLSGVKIKDFKKFYLNNRSAIEKRVAFFKHAASLDPKNMQVDNPLHDLLSIESEVSSKAVIRKAYRLLRKALSKAKLSINGSTKQAKKVNLVSKSLRKVLKRKKFRIARTTELLGQSIKAKRIDYELMGLAAIGLAYQVGHKKLPKGVTHKHMLSRFYHLRAITKHKKRNFTGSVKDSTKAIRLDRKNMLAYMARATTRAEQGKNKMAIRDLNYVLRKEPKNIAALMIRMRVKELMKDFRGAKRDAKKILKIKPSVFTMQVRLLAAKGKLKAALAVCNKLISLAPRMKVLYLLRVEIKVARKDFKGALADCKTVIRLDRKSAIAYLSMSKIKAVQKNLKGAMQDVNTAIRLKPKFAAAYLFKGKLQAAKNDHVGAIKSFKKVISLQPKNITAYLMLANSKYASKDAAGALKALDAAVKLRPKNVTLLFIRGKLKMHMKKYKLAAVDFTKVLALKPNFKEAKRLQQICFRHMLPF